MSTDAGNDRYDLAVANLKVASVGSIGGNLRSANSDPAALLTTMGTSMLRQKAGEGSAEVTEGSAETTGAATSTLCSTSTPYFRAYLGPLGAGGAHMRAAEPRGPGHPRRQPTRAHYFRVLNQAYFRCHANILKARWLAREEYR